MQDTGLSIARAGRDPAAAAAAMLLRLGFSLFALVIPSATLMSRWVIVVLVPIGCVLLILAAMMKGDPTRLIIAAFARLASIAGLAALMLIVWAFASLLWAPNPAIAAEKISKTLGVVLLGFIAVVSLPARMRASNLHLVTIGVALGAALVLLVGASEARWLADYAIKVPAGTPGRAMILLSCLGWAGAAWLLIKGRPVLAVALMALVFLAALVQPGGEAVVPVAAGFLVFALAWFAPERTGWAVGAAVAATIILAPLVLWGAESAARAGALAPDGLIARLGLWNGVFFADPLHLLTGRGFDAANCAREVGFIPAAAPIVLVADLWFDLGLIGTLALAILILSIFGGAGRFGLEVAPLALAGLTTATVFALLERGATQTWWLNGMVVFALVLMSVERGRYRTIRPRATLGARRSVAEAPAA